ncbi:hypothetical protein BU17DRAFT_82468 [Hysterangium stoloniferum]|nr:hypothetical protein BU17DRAFT_82468 [Hysterangium stoloniferum]
MRSRTTHPTCPFCRTPFQSQDIRWLFLQYEYDFPSDQADCSTSHSTSTPTLLTWLKETGVELERRWFALTDERNCSSQNVLQLHSEIQSWLTSHRTSRLPGLPEARVLQTAAAALSMVSRRESRISDLRKQVAMMRRDMTIMNKRAAQDEKARQLAEVKDIEIKALRDLNRLYRHASETKGRAQLPFPRQIESHRFSDYNKARSEDIVEIKQSSRYKVRKLDAKIRDDQKAPNDIEKSVTWFRTTKHARRTGKA